MIILKAYVNYQGFMEVSEDIQRFRRIFGNRSRNLEDLQWNFYCLINQ